MTALQVIWFFLVGVLFVGYAILDGFDLGVGFWHLRAKGDDERRAMLNAVGPVWDGNEVWLLTAGGALFGAFPAVYASVFSGFYLALMLVLLVLMARAISFEFRSQVDSPGWRSAWDVIFSVSSTVAIVLFGVALGNILRGIPLDAAGNYTGTFFGLLNPFALMTGVLGLAMLAFHGALYMVIKGSGDLEERARGWVGPAGYVYLALFVVTAVGHGHHAGASARQLPCVPDAVGNPRGGALVHLGRALPAPQRRVRPRVPLLEPLDRSDLGPGRRRSLSQDGARSRRTRAEPHPRQRLVGQSDAQGHVHHRLDRHALA